MWDFGSHPPSKTSTSSERWVLMWVAILAVIGIGGVCVYVGFNPAPEKEGEAEILRAIGYCFVGAGVGAVLLYRVITWWIDSV